jgi:Zn-dependent peptidase ImmA (M78 family)
MMPGDEVLISLADALDQPLDFFFRPFSVKLKGVAFRKITGVGSKTLEAIREQAADFFERYLEIEQVLGLPRKFRDPLGDFHLGKVKEVEEAAAKVRSAWGLGSGPLPNILETLESNGIKIFEVEGPEGFDGFSGWIDGHPVITLAAWLQQDLSRKRFTALHEAAHLLIQPHTNLVCGKELESFCHRFAGAMLLPREIFKKEWGGYRHRIALEELMDYKGRYGISIGGLMRRALDLELIDVALYKRFIIAYKRNGWHKHEPGEFTGTEVSTRFERLVLMAGAEEMISLARGAALLRTPLEVFREKMNEAA